MNENRFSVCNEKNRLPAVYIDLPTTEKIWGDTFVAPGEIRGWGMVEQIDTGGTTSLWVTDILPLLNQNTSGGKTIEDQRELAKLLSEYPNPETLKFQWHSHDNFPVGFSGDDTETIESYDNGAVDYMINLVVNKHTDHICRVDIFNPFRAYFFTEVFTILPIRETVLVSSRQEILEKVSFNGKRIKPENLKTMERRIIVPWKNLSAALTQEVR